MQAMESLPILSVQAMVTATGRAPLTPRYVRPEAAADAIAGEAQIPIINYRRLLLEDHGDESARLHRICRDCGFFQVIRMVTHWIHEWSYLLPESQRAHMDSGCTCLETVARDIYNQGGWQLTRRLQHA